MYEEKEKTQAVDELLIEILSITRYQSTDTISGEIILDCYNDFKKYLILTDFQLDFLKNFKSIMEEEK